MKEMLRTERIGNACEVVYRPGDGTRCRILVVEDPQGGFAWIWLPESQHAVAAGWASETMGGEIRGEYLRGRGDGSSYPHLGPEVRKIIGHMLDQSARAAVKA